MKKLLAGTLVCLAIPLTAYGQTPRLETVDCTSSSTTRPTYAEWARMMTTSFSLICNKVPPGTRITMHVRYLGLYKRHPRGGPWIAHKTGQATMGQVPVKVIGTIAIRTLSMGRTVRAAPQRWYWQGRAKVTVIGRYNGQTSTFTKLFVSPIVEHLAR